ncbi:fetuin-B-like [Acipenser ruthenus]|uniref:fetuin-B-like n=1 Tax=Acipenser ruthenus TaxID=7906 RepID=UPI002741979D|nr:fetuin-B-like [Acipenser ruthenus]XP_058890540.1 fetuin-B-like [Acipenser ruthenus]
MKQFALLLLCTQLLYVWAVSEPVYPLNPGSCECPDAVAAADLALRKINSHRNQGYIFSYHRLSNVNQKQKGPMGTVFYLTIDVLETSCNVLSKRLWTSCEVRPLTEAVYGQCQATIYINKVERAIRLYNYNCSLRPVPRNRVHDICLNCPEARKVDDPAVLNATQLVLQKYNNESPHLKYFALLNVTKASEQALVAKKYALEFTIQETVCPKVTHRGDVSQCELMTCEFAHKGHCKGSYMKAPDNEYITVSCELFEPEASQQEEKPHLLGGEHDHHHDKHADHHDYGHDQHEHGPGHHHHDKHADHHDDGHDQHEHGPGHHHHDKHEDHHDDGHDQHEHGPGHHHHHKHLHAHEHHHPGNISTFQRAITPHYEETEGEVLYLPPIDVPTVYNADADKPVTLPSFPDIPVAFQGPIIHPFPTMIGEKCPGQPKNKVKLIQQLYKEDQGFFN